MPTSSITSTLRCRDLGRPSTSACASIASLNWAPIVVTGLSAFIALCMTTE